MPQKKITRDWKNIFQLIGNFIIVAAMMMTLMLYVGSFTQNARNSALTATKISVEHLAATSRVYFTAQTDSVRNIAEFIQSEGMTYEDAFAYLDKLRLTRRDQAEGYAIFSRTLSPDVTYGQMYAGNCYMDGLHSVPMIPYDPIYKYLHSQDTTEHDIQVFAGTNPYSKNTALVFYANLSLSGTDSALPEKFRSDNGYLLCYYCDTETLLANGLAVPELKDSSCIIVDSNGVQVVASKGNDMGSSFEYIFNYYEVKVDEADTKNAAQFAANRIRQELKGNSTFLERLNIKRYGADPIPTYHYFVPLETSANLYYVAVFPEASLTIGKLNYTLPIIIVLFMLLFLLLNLLIVRQKNRQLKESVLAVEAAKNAAEQANHSKSLFLANMSHDIRTPMNAIVGMTDIMSENLDRPKQLNECLQQINVSSQLLLGIINDILDMSRIESGKVTLTLERFSLREFISTIDVLMRPQTEKRKQVFTIHEDAAISEDMVADHLRLQRILINMLSNANKYTGDGGTITLTVSQVQDGDILHYQFRVADTGIGMKPEYVSHIFDAFSREESSMVNKVQGTGLGMAICKNLVELMDGQMTVESELGKGSVFTVSIPVKGSMLSDSTIPRVSLMASPKDRHQNVHFGGDTVLLVEDNPINRKIAIRLLERVGLKVRQAENGQEGLERFLDSPPFAFACILMDVQMPVMNGYEAASAIRAQQRPDAQSIPIIAMTANVFREDIEAAMNSGMNAHLAKPIDVGNLESILMKYIHPANEERTENK